MLALIGGLGPQEIILILLVVLFVFGASKLPEIGRSLGTGIREFKKGITDSGEDKNAIKSEPESPRKEDASK